jgi:hypothetical protein
LLAVELAPFLTPEKSGMSLSAMIFISCVRGVHRLLLGDFFVQPGKSRSGSMMVPGNR